MPIRGEITVENNCVTEMILSQACRDWIVLLFLFATVTNAYLSQRLKNEHITMSATIRQQKIFN